jgi:hypothetical protein
LERGRKRSHPSSDWFFFLVSDWLLDTGPCHLIGQISWLLIAWTHPNPFLFFLVNPKGHSAFYPGLGLAL